MVTVVVPTASQNRTESWSWFHLVPDLLDANPVISQKGAGLSIPMASGAVEVEWLLEMY